MADDAEQLRIFKEQLDRIDTQSLDINKITLSQRKEVEIYDVFCNKIMRMWILWINNVTVEQYDNNPIAKEFLRLIESNDEYKTLRWNITSYRKVVGPSPQTHHSYYQHPVMFSNKTLYHLLNTSNKTTYDYFRRHEVNENTVWIFLGHNHHPNYTEDDIYKALDNIEEIPVGVGRNKFVDSGQAIKIYQAFCSIVNEHIDADDPDDIYKEKMLRKNMCEILLEFHDKLRNKLAKPGSASHGGKRRRRQSSKQRRRRSNRYY